MLKLIKLVVGLCFVLVLQACVTMASQRFVLKSETFSANYPKIKQIIVEEAANNGFKELSSEVKPSEYNNWEGKLFFQLTTPNGTDQLVANFKKTDSGVSVWVNGAGTRANPDSAAKAIEARLRRL